MARRVLGKNLCAMKNMERNKFMVIEEKGKFVRTMITIKSRYLMAKEEKGYWKCAMRIEER